MSVTQAAWKATVEIIVGRYDSAEVFEKPLIIVV
jgi:hypothetical protein